MPSKRSRSKRQVGVYLDKAFLDRAKKVLEERGITFTELFEAALLEAIQTEKQTHEQKKRK